MSGKVRGRNSFTDGEVQLLAYIFNCLLRSTEPSIRVVQGHTAFQSLARKCIAMKQQVAAQKAAAK